MKKNNKKKPLIRALEPRILFDGAAITTAIEVLDNTSFNTTDSTDSTKINDATTPDAAQTPTEKITVEAGDIFIITNDIPNYEVTAQNFAANFKVMILDQNSNDLKNQIMDATKDLDKDLNVHIIAANQNRDKLLVGSYDSVGDLIGGLTSDSKLYDLNDLSEQNFTQSGSNQVVIIDEAVSYSQDLLNTIPADWKIITIDSNKDGLTQILEKLDGISNISAIHIFSHANSGEIILGNLTLDSNTLNTRANDLKTLGTHLNQSGDILLYGCDVSSGFIGLDFVNEFALLTGADIAASDDKTGSYISNANFNLETTTGNIEAQSISYDTNGTVLGYVNTYVFDINKNGPRLNYQASGQAYSGWWNGTDNNWVDYYTNDREVSYFGIKWITVNALFFSFSFPIPWINYYSYGTGVRYGVQEFTVAHDSRFQITANADGATQNQLGGDRTQNVLAENYALYKVVNGVGFDKYNPLRNLVTASEGLFAGGVYLGELEAGKYQVVASFDTWRWWPDIISLMTLNQYAEQFFEPVNLRVENLNRAPVWGSIADQTIIGDGNKNIISTAWSNASDADGDEMNASAFLLNGSTEEALPYWLTFNPNSLTFSGNPPANTGTLNIRIKAFDGQEYGYKDFKLTFSSDNDRPIVANEIKDLTWDGQGSFEYQIPTGTFTDADPDADTFTYTAKLSDGSALPSWLSISSSGLISGNPPADFANLQITVTANDGSNQANATQTDTFVLNLKNNNDIATVNDRIITIDEDNTHIFSLADFVYTDTDTHSHADTSSGTGKTIQSIRIVELPKNGTLWLDSDNDNVLDNGETVQTNQVILATSISKLKYTPNANWAGHGVLTPSAENNNTSSAALITGPDSFKWVSSDAYNESSNIATTTLNVRLVNDDPILSFSAGKTLNIRPNGGTALSAVFVDEGLNLIDPDALYSNDSLFDTIFGVSVTIVDSTTNKFVNGDTLALTNTNGFTVSYDSVKGILSIEKEGGASAAQYQTILRTLQFSSTDTTNNNLRTLGLSFRTQDVGSKTSAYFDGVDDYIETMNASIPTSGDFTVSVWAKLDNPSSLIANNYSIFGQGDSGSHVYLAIQKFSNDTYHLRIGDDWTITNLSSLLSDGKWHQYTITKSGNSSSDGSVFIDGKYIASGDIKDYIASGYGLRIGKLYDKTFNSGDDWTGYWKGSISDLRIYNKALGALDIQKSLSNTLVGNESGLNAWYKLVSDYKNYASVSSDGGNAVVFKQADYGYGIKTGHYYKVDTTSRDYANATSNAQDSSYAGENGYLLRLDDSLSTSELEIAKMLETLKAPDSYWYWIGAERYNSNGDWYWTAGPDSDVYFNHGSNEGLDNDPTYWNTAYGPTGWWGAFAGTWQYSPWITTNNAQTQVTYTFYAWDSWDHETFRTNLNGTTLFDINTVHDSYWNGNNSYSSGININGYYISYTITPKGIGNFGRSGWWDKPFDITINIPENFSLSIQLSFGAYTSQDLGDESAEIVNFQVKTLNSDYSRDKAFMTGSGYIENYYPSHQSWSIIEYGNKGEILSAPSLFATTNTALPDKYVNETRSITIRQTNNAPALVATGAVNWHEDGEIKFQPSNFIVNFSDIDGDTLSKVVITSVPDATQGQFLLNGVALENGALIPTGDLDKLVLKPLADFNGVFTFKYKASDGYLLSNESTVTVTINAINDAPVLTSNQTLTAINEDILNTANFGQTIASIISDGTITDVDGTAIEAIAITSINNSYGIWQYSINNGTSWANISTINGAKINLGSSALLLDNDSLLRFIPNANFNGTSTFEFRAWDKSSGTIGGTTNPLALGGNNSVSADVKTATITINSVNDTPITESKTISIDEDITYVFTTNDFKFTDIDTSDVLTSVKIATLPTLGTIKLNGVDISANAEISKADIEAGKLTYLTALDGNGTSYSSFTFNVSDGTIDSSTATITFDVNDTNDAPTDISWASGGSVPENSAEKVVVGQLSAIDLNTGDELRFVRVENSKFNISTTGLVTVAKDAYLDFEKNRTQTIKVKVTDSQGLSYIKDLTVNITDVIENTPTLYTNILYAQKNTVETITESTLRTEDADTDDLHLVYRITQAIEGGILFLDSNNNGVYNEGTDTIFGPESSEAPEYKANFTHQDVVDGKIKFAKDNTQINAKVSLEVSDGNEKDEGLVIIVVSNPPVLSAAIDDQEWGLTGVQNFTIPASTFTDADFDVLTYSAKLSNNDPLPSWLSFNSTTGKFTGTPPAETIDGSQIEITVTATDGRTTPASDTFIIIFKETITKPVIANPLPEYIEFSGSGIKTYTIPENTFTNPIANTTITYNATLGNGNALPSWLSFDATTRTFSGNPPASAVSEPLILKITASNGTTTATTIKLYISDSNDIPVNSATIDNKTINDANSHTYTIYKSTFSDGDNDTITLSLATQDGSEVPSWIKFSTDETTGDLIITAKAPAGSGEQLLRVLGSDGNGGEAVSDFKITYSGGTNESPQVKTSAGISYMQNGVLVTSAYGATEKFSILAGKTSTITTKYLDENDADDDGAGLTYTIVNEPLYGQLWIDSDADGTISGSEKTLSAGDTFTQKDIDDRKLKYKHTAPNTTDDKFVFNLKDGGENGSAEVKNVTFNIDVLANPTSLSIVSLTRLTPSDVLTNDDEVKFKVKFSGVAFAVDTSDFEVTGSGNSGATVSNVTNLGSSEYMITVSNITSNNGDIGIALKSDTNIITTGGSAVDKTFVPNVNETFTLDNITPTVTINPDITIYAGTTSFKATLTFSEKIGGLSLADITAVNATISNLVQVDDTNFTFDVTPTGNTNNITLDFANAMVTDIAGNNNTASAQVTITRNIIPTISNINTTATFTEIDGVDTSANDVLFSNGISLDDLDSTQDLQNLKISIPTASILDGAKDQLIVDGTVISLNFTDGKAIENITINTVEYKITATVSGGISTLTFEKASGKMTLAQAEALLDLIKYNNSSDTPTTTTNRVFSLVVNDGLENSATSTVTVSVVATNDTPTISVGSTDTASKNLTESNTTLNASGTLSIVDLDGSGALSVNDNSSSNTTTSNTTSNPLVEKPASGNEASGTNPPTIFDPGAVLNVPDKYSYVSIPNSSELQVQNYTIEMWVKPNGTSSEWQPLIVKSDGTGLTSTRNFSIWIMPNSLELHNTFFNQTTGQQVVTETGINTLALNQWNHITATYNGTYLKTFINGIEVSSIAASGTTIKDTNSLYIGGLPQGYATLGAFKGDIAEVRIYNTALDATTISNTMQTQLTGNETNLVYYTRFDTDANGKIVDLTATNNSGTLNGTAKISGQLSLNEDSSHTFSANEFSTNYLYTDTDAFGGIKVINLPTNGTLKLSGVTVSANEIISSANIANLVYTANSDFSGTDRFYFKAIDSTSASSTTEALNITVVAVNDAPTAQNKTISINKNVSTLLSTSDFGYSDIDNDIMASIKITTLPTVGTLQYYNGTSWQTVSSNQVITKADIDANKLRFTPVTNEAGNAYATFKFMLNDGTADSTEKTITYNVIAADVSILSIESVAKDGVIDGLTSSDATLLEMLSLSAENETINWDFNSISEHFDYLAVDEVLTLTYTIKATDSSNTSAFDTQTITIKITGTNDKPNITASTTSALSNTDSDNDSNTMFVTAEGALSFNDVDETDTPTASFVKETDTSYIAVKAIGGGNFVLNTDAITALKNALTLNSNGSWTYSLDTTLLKDTTNTIIALGDKVSVIYTITIADENGGSITKDLKFSFIGTGTGGTLIVNGDAGSIVEGSKLSDAGSLTADSSTISSVSLNSSTITPTGISLTSQQETDIKDGFSITKTSMSVNWVYNINETKLDFLTDGSSVKAEFNIVINDVQKTVTIIIQGTNDTPIITSTVADARGSVTEAGNNVTGTATASDTLTSSDVDSGATKTWSFKTSADSGVTWTYPTTISGTYGGISIDSLTGVWTYTLDNTKSATKALQTGDKKTETFVATISDGTDSAQQTIIVEVNGTNDAPTLTLPATITFTDTNADNTFASQTGTLSSSDDDANDTEVFNITGQSADTSENGFTHSKVGTYGTLYLNAISGAYKYIPNDAKIEALTADTSETFDFTVTDSKEASDTKTLTINITATNDTPTITVETNNSDADSLYETNSTLTTSGTLSVTDLDLTNIVSSVVVSSMTIDGSSSTDVTALSWLTLNTDSILSNTETTDTLTWTFDSGSEYFNSLSQGDTKILVYTIRVNDGTVAADKTVTITILGTNDAPTISVESGDLTTSTLTETNSTLTATDTITINEIEPNDTITATVESVSVNSTSSVSNLALPTNAILKAMLSLDKTSLLTNTTDTSEVLTWTFDSTTEHFDKIASGETLILDYVVKVSDNANPSKVDTKVIKITINGANDAPVIDTYTSTDANINAQIESGKPLKLADTGTIAFSDIDFSNRPTASETLKSITALRRDTTTTFTLTSTQQTNIENAFNISADTNNTQNGSINWEYAISQANIDFLGAGETIEAIFTITIKDFTTGLSDTQDIKIKIVGENKVPTLTASTKDVNESNSSIVETISMTAEDGNMSDSLSVSVLSGTYKLNSDAPISMTNEQLSWLSLNTTTYANSIVVNGTETSKTFNWDFNTNGKIFDELNTGETVKLVYTVKVIDDAPIPYSSTKTVTVTITGTNDTPIAVIDVANTNENTPITIDVLANDTDIDSLDNSSNFTLTNVSITTNNHSTGYDSSKVTTAATATIVDNKLVFTPNDEFDYLALNDTATVTVTYRMSDDEGLTSSNTTTTITITGTNDAPTISIGTTDKVFEEFIENINKITTSGTLSLNDKDTLNTVSASVETVVISGSSHIDGRTNDYFKSMLKLTSANILDNAHNDGTITWNFDSGSDTFDYIAKDEELILTYTIKALDVNSGATTQDVIIKIKGTNDTPVLDAILSKTYTDTNIDDTFASYSGTLVSSDVDLTDGKIYSITSQTADTSETGFTHSKLGNYGKLYINEITGAYKYITTDALIEELTTNVTDEFNFNVIDDSQETNNINTKTFAVNLIGANDKAIISVETGNSANKTLNETNGTLTTSGTLSVSDLDTTQTVSVSKIDVVTTGITDGLVSTNEELFTMLSIDTQNVIDNLHTTGTINWAFSSGSEAFDYLANGEILTLTYTIKATDSALLDSNNQTIVINIQGTNDTPNITIENLDSVSKTLKETNSTLSTSGTLSVKDIDTSDVITTSVVVSSNPTTAIGNSILEDMLTTTLTPIDATTQTGTINWVFNSGSEAFNYLATGETLTLTYTIKATDDDSSLSNDTQTVVITITGTNDTPTVLLENIDEKTPFGKEYVKETAYLFSDLDRTDIFTFEASNLPLGLSINPNTGEITGRAVEPGIFIITLKATDSGTPALNVSRTFSLLVIAPAQNDSGQTTQAKSTNEVAQQIIKEITVDRITDIINSSNTSNSTISENSDSKNTIETLINTQNNDSLGKISSNNNGADITRTELTSIVQSNSNNPNDKIITANASLNLDTTGKVNFDNKSNDAFEIVGLTIERIDLVQEQLEIKVVDTRVGQKYVVTLIDGSELPDTLSFDPNTGKIIGVLPDGVNELNISIKALSNDGTTRILNLKIDLKELKQNQTAFNSLSEQIQTQDFKMTNYGDFISSLFNKSVSV